MTRARDVATQGGLVLLNTTNVGSAVTSVTVNNVFSSTYDNYRILIGGVDASSQTNLRIQFGSTTNEHYGSHYYDFYASGSTGTDRIVNAANMYIGVTNTSDDTSSSLDVFSPNLTKRTTFAGNFDGFAYAGWFGGGVNTTIQYTSFNILVSTGTITGGTIKVYGYK